MENTLEKHVKLISAVLIGTTIVCLTYFAGKIIIPIIFSAILAMFLSPAKSKLVSWGLPKALASFITVIAATTFIVGLFFILSLESKKIIGSLPTEKIEDVINKPGELIENNPNLATANNQKFIDEAFTKTKTVLIGFIPGTLMSIKNTVVFFLTCPIYIFFMLFCTSNLRAFYYDCFKNKNKALAHEVLKEIEEAFGAYIKGIIMVILIISTLTTIGLFLLGIDFAFFLGLLAGILTLIPYIGVLTSAVIPVIIALLTKDSFWYAGGVVVLFTAVQFLEGNFITPKIVGHKVDINPLMIIFGLVVFGAIAGIAGMIITIPLLALIKIVAAKIPNWKPLHSLLKV